MINIKNDFINIGISKGLSIEVHSSIKSISDQNIDPNSIITDLKNIITSDGNIIMPAFPLSKCLPLTKIDLSLGIIKKCKWLPENHNERTDMGIIADTFYKTSGTVTGSGQHRMAAWGKKASQYVNDLMDFVDDNGHGLLIGVDIRTLTAMHYVENNIPDDVWPKLFKPMNEEIKKIYNQNEYFITTEILPKYHKGWLKVQKMAEDKGLIAKGKIVNAESMFFRVKDVISIYENELKHNISELFDIE
jgi:aminoglycoside N3'-acetyltransferase